jgi:hypothetical protein
MLTDEMQEAEFEHSIDQARGIVDQFFDRGAFIEVAVDFSPGGTQARCACSRSALLDRKPVHVRTESKAQKRDCGK